MTTKPYPHWLTPADGAFRRSLVVLTIAAGVVAALVASAHFHGDRPAHSLAARA